MLRIAQIYPSLLVSASCCLSISVKIFPFKSLSFPRWTFQPHGRAPLGRLPASACLSHRAMACRLALRLSAFSALLPSHWTAGSLSTGLGLRCSYQTRHSPKWGPAPHPSPNCPLSSFLEGETRGLQIVHNQLIHLPPPNSRRGLTL